MIRATIIAGVSLAIIVTLLMVYFIIIAVRISRIDWDIWKLLGESLQQRCSEQRGEE